MSKESLHKNLSTPNLFWDDKEEKGENISDIDQLRAAELIQQRNKRRKTLQDHPIPAEEKENSVKIPVLQRDLKSFSWNSLASLLLSTLQEISQKTPPNSPYIPLNSPLHLHFPLSAPPSSPNPPGSPLPPTSPRQAPPSPQNPAIFIVAPPTQLQHLGVPQVGPSGVLNLIQQQNRKSRRTPLKKNMADLILRDFEKILSLLIQTNISSHYGEDEGGFSGLIHNSNLKEKKVKEVEGWTEREVKVKKILGIFSQLFFFPS